MTKQFIRIFYGGSIILIVLSIAALFVVSIWKDFTIIMTKNIENSELSIVSGQEKLEGKNIDLPKTKFDVVTLDDPAAGSPEASVHIVEFSDFQCPFCKRSFPIVLRILEEYGDKIHFIYRDFPLKSHAYAQKAAEAAECAQDQDSFWPMHNKIFKNQNKMTIVDLKRYGDEIGLDKLKFDQCLDSGKYTNEVKSDYEDGERAGVRGTPTFFINDQVVNGAESFEKMKAIIDKELGIIP